MRLQQKLFPFRNEKGEIPSGKILTSRVVVNDNPTEKLVSDLFSGIKRERNGAIKGYSILEFLSDKGYITVNEKNYHISFLNDNEKFSLKPLEDPTDYILNDKELSDEQLKEIETFIETSAPPEVPKQPQETQAPEETPQGLGADLYENEDYQEELVELKESGYKELQTEPKSNYRLLTKEDSDNVLIEIYEDDYEVLDISEYEIVVSENNFTIKEND